MSSLWKKVGSVVLLLLLFAPKGWAEEDCRTQIDKIMQGKNSVVWLNLYEQCRIANSLERIAEVMEKKEEPNERD